MTMRLYATEHNWPLESVVVRVTHDRQNLTSRDQFLKEIQIDGALSLEQKQALLEVSMRCPIHMTVARGSNIDTRLLLELIQADVPQTTLLICKDSVKARIKNYSCVRFFAI